MGSYKHSHDAIHDHQVECFASENGLTSDLVWELILKHGNSRTAVMKAAQGLKDDVRRHGPISAPCRPCQRALTARRKTAMANSRIRKSEFWPMGWPRISTIPEIWLPQ